MRLFAEHGTHTRHHGACACALLDDLVRCYSRLFNIGRFGSQPLPASISMGDNGRQRLVQFMRYRRSHFTHAESARQARQLILRHIHSLLRAVLLLHVNMDAIASGNFSLSRMLGNTPNQEPSINAVGTAYSRLHFEPFASGNCTPPIPAEHRLVNGMKNCEESLPLQVLGSSTDVIDQVLIAILDMAAGVRAPHLLRDGLCE